MKYLLRVVAVVLAVSIGLVGLLFSACGSTASSAQIGLVLGLTACAVGAWIAFDGVRAALRRPTAAQCDPAYRMHRFIGAILLLAAGLPLCIWAVVITVEARTVSGKDPSWQLTGPAALTGIALLGWAVAQLRRATSRNTSDH